MKKVSILALILASFMLLTVAPAYAETAATAAPATDAAAATEGTPVYGQVTQVDENTITIALAAMPEAAPAAADATAAPDAAAAPAALSLTGETMTVTVNDATAVTLKGANGAEDTAGTMADIAVGSIVTVTLTDNTATAITVESAAAEPASETAAEAPAANG